MASAGRFELESAVSAWAHDLYSLKQSVVVGHVMKMLELALPSLLPGGVGCLMLVPQLTWNTLLLEQTRQ
jgi:hypothetical protein